MADHETNPFETYDADMNQAAQRAAQDEQMYAAHEEWLKTTWQGRIVGWIQALGLHFKPFFLAVSEAIQEEQSARILGHVLRVIIVLVGIVSLYVIANIIQSIIGKEIVIEEEVVIIEEVKQSDLDKELDGSKGDETVTVESKRRSQRTSREKKTQ